MGNNNQLNQIFEDIKNSLEKLNEKVDKQEQRMNKIEDRLSGNQSQLSYKKATKQQEPPVIRNQIDIGPPPPPPPPPPGYYDRKPSEKATDTLQDLLVLDGIPKKSKILTLNEVEENPQDIGFEAPRKSEEFVSLEQIIGANLFAKIGAVVLILGMSFFLKYAFDHNWINEVGRVVLGILAGLVLLGIGEKTIRKYSSYGQVISGTGIAFLYLSIYAALNFYQLIGYLEAFFFMGIVTTIGIVLSLRYNAMSLIMFSIVGGFLTPILIKSGQNDKFTLFPYIILLDTAIMAVSYFKRWRWLNFVGFVGTVFVFGNWMDRFYSEDQLLSTMVFLTVFFIIYSVSSLIYNLANKEESNGFEQAITLLTGVFYFATSFGIMDKLYHDYMGMFAFIIAVYYLLWAYLVRHLTPKDNNLYNFLAFLTVGFVTLAIPLQFEKFVITIMWAIEGALLYYTATVIKEEGQKTTLKIFGLVVTSIALFRTVFIDVGFYNIDSLMFMNKPFFSTIFVIAAFYVQAVGIKFNELIKKPDNKYLLQTLMIFIILANVLTVFSVSREILVYKDRRISQEVAEYNRQNEVIKKEYGNKSEYLKYVPQEFRKETTEKSYVALSLFWLVYALILVSIGVLRRYYYLFELGVVFMSIPVIKLLLYDLWEIDTYYRLFLSSVTIFILYVTSMIIHQRIGQGEEKIEHINLKKVFVLIIVVANVVTFVAGNKEIYDYNEKKVTDVRSEYSRECSYSTKSFNKFGSMGFEEVTSEKCVNLKDKIKWYENMASVSMSLFWMLYSIILITFGFTKKIRIVRIGGIALLLLAIIKLFIYDLWSLGQLYRIIAFMSLGVVLLSISFVYYKYKDKLKEII